MTDRDVLVEALAEVDRLRQAVDDAVHLYHQALEERDEAVAAVARVQALTDDHRNSVRSCREIRRALNVGGQS